MEGSARPPAASEAEVSVGQLERPPLGRLVSDAAQPLSGVGDKDGQVMAGGPGHRASSSFDLNSRAVLPAIA